MNSISELIWWTNGLLHPSVRDDRAGYVAGTTDAVRGLPAADASNFSEHYRLGYDRGRSDAFAPEVREFTEWLIRTRQRALANA